MDAGQRSTKVSSAPAPAPAVKRIQERDYFDGYTWAEVFLDPLVLVPTALHLFFFWYLCRDMKLVELSAKNLLGCMLLFGVVAQYALVFLFALFCDHFGNFVAPMTAATGGGGGRGPAAGPIGRTTTAAPSPAPPPPPSRIVVDAAAHPVVSVFCNPCGAYLSLKWCMGLDKYVIGCSCPSNVVVERCIDSSGQRQLRICIPIG